MSYFISNIVIGMWAFAGWYFSGLGFALALLPLRHRHNAFILAPLIGVCLLTLINLFQITILLVPLTPRINIALLILSSLILCWWMSRYSFQQVWKRFYVRLRWLWLLPLLILLAFSWLFHVDGFHLLVGGSDQLQYSQNARHMIEQMHTDSALDIPIPRQDHFISEMSTQLLPYDKTYRRGAEVILAATSVMTHLTFEEAFPVVVLCALLTLSLSLGFIGGFFLHSRWARLILQATFFSSFYLVLLHVQGSLALINSLAPGLVGLVLLSRITSEFSWRWVLLTGIVIAAYLSMYSEPAFINVVLPSAVLVMSQFRYSRARIFSTFLRISILFLIVFAFSFYSFRSLYSNLIGNLIIVYQQILTTAATTVSSQAASFKSVLQQGELLGVIFGSNSYYATNALNANIAIWIHDFPWLGWLGFTVFCMFSLLGFLKNKNQRLAMLFMMVFFLWIISSLLLAYQNDSLRFARSIHYLVPFMMIGLVLLSFNKYRKEKNNFWIISTWMGRGLLLFFVVMNINTHVQTMNFITSHRLDNDPILLRFSERDALWQQLKNELYFSKKNESPILFAGFNETIRPLAIATLVRSQPQVLDSSISNFWKIYGNIESPKTFTKWSKFNTRRSEDEFKERQRQETHPWSRVAPRLIQRSEQAIVPVNYGFPNDWKASQDVYEPHVKHFPNICDVVYRNKFAIGLSNKMTSSLKQDAIGPFRLLSTSGPVIIHDPVNSPRKLVIEYEGKKDDVKLQVNNQFYRGDILKKGIVRVTYNVHPENANELRLVVTKPVKLRSIRLSPENEQ